MKEKILKFLKGFLKISTFVVVASGIALSYFIAKGFDHYTRTTFINVLSIVAALTLFWGIGFFNPTHSSGTTMGYQSANILNRKYDMNDRHSKLTSIFPSFVNAAIIEFIVVIILIFI